MADRTAEIEFLQQQVQRLNAVLTQHQVKAQPNSSPDGQELPPSSEAHHASWLTDKTLLNPLLTEYDNIISQLQQKISTYQNELMSLNSRVEQVTTENARLHQELCESVESQMAKEGRVEGEREGLRRSTAALQDQLSHISKDRDEYREKCRQMTFELERLKNSDQEKSLCLEKYKNELATAEHNVLALQQKMEELQTACVKLNEDYNKSVESAHSGGLEVEQLKQALSNARVQCKALQLKNSELLRAHSELEQQLRKQEADREALDGQGRVIDGRVHLLELANAELEAKLVAALSDVSVLTNEKAELEESIALQQNRLAGLEREVHQAVAHVKESMDMVESAILDKDQAVMVSEHKAQEVEKLRASMEALLQEAGQRTRREVEAVRADYNRNIDRMAEEIQKLEEECGEKQAYLEGSQRETKLVEMELERVKEKLLAETAKAGDSLQRQQSRVLEAERVAEEARRKMEGALVAQQAAETSLVEEKRRHEELCGELRRRVREGEEEGVRGSEERAQLARQARELLEQLSSEREAREAGERKAKQEVAVVSQHWELRERELQQRLQAREQSHNQSMEELREMLSSQFREAARWKEESNCTIKQFEENIRDLRNEVASYRKRAEASKIEIDTLTRQKEQQAKQLEKFQAKQTRLQQHLRASDSRAEAAATQVSSLLLREKQLLGERRELQRQLDKLKLEITRRAGLIMGAPCTTSLPPPIPHLPEFPTSTPLPADPLTSPVAVQGGRGWEEVLAGLRESIRQARQEMEDTRAHHTQAPISAVATTQHPVTDAVAESGRDSSPDSSTVLSDLSSLHRADLSHSPLT